jgi:hypothetical protein
MQSLFNPRALQSLQEVLETSRALQKKHVYSFPALSLLAAQQLHVLAKKFSVDLSMPISAKLRVVLAWDTDMTDLELLVLEPNQGTCSAFTNQTKNGNFIENLFLPFLPSPPLLEIYFFLPSFLHLLLMGFRRYDVT